MKALDEALKRKKLKGLDITITIEAPKGEEEKEEEKEEEAEMEHEGPMNRQRHGQMMNDEFPDMVRHLGPLSRGLKKKKEE